MNEQLKPYKTVEEIAKKHRLEVSFIQKQLDMGAPIEHEHTKNQKLATEIALQHLDEIPDYYTRLKKMEIDAKKHHKKFKDVKEATDGVGAKSPNYNLKKWFDDGGWVQAGGKYDGKPCAKQPGQKTKPYCRDPDDRAAMSKDERNKRAAKKRKEDPNPNRSGKAKMVTQESAGKKDACYKKVKSRYDVWPSAYASGALVKCRKVGAANWGTKSEDCWDGYEQKGMKKKGKKIVPNCVPVKEEHAMIRYCPKCKKDETRSECKFGPKYWDMYSLPPALSSISDSTPNYDANSPHPGNMPEEKDHEYSMARSELSTIQSAVERLRKRMKGEGNIEAWVQSKITKAADYLDSAADYLDSGEHNVDESITIQNLEGDDFIEFVDIIKPEALKPSIGIGSKLLGEKKLYSNWREELAEDWQSVNRKDKTDGLSPAAVKAYRRENPGSKLQTAVTEKKPKGKRAKRRKNFCSRMSGMKSKLTSTKTARDPDSRINKALRRWNCN
ncbi:MAG: DUF5661 family protein [Candidatus Nanopelagicales bacterium]